jgi:hypothetical protein
MGQPTTHLYSAALSAKAVEKAPISIDRQSSKSTAIILVTEHGLDALGIFAQRVRAEEP